MKLLELKQNLDKIQITNEDLWNLKKIKEDKTLAIHFDRIKKGKFEKVEINALTKLIASQRFAKDERKNSISSLMQLSLEHVGTQYVSGNFQLAIMHFKKPMKISKEQTMTGKSYLRNYLFNKKGELRNSQAVKGMIADYGTRFTEIAKSVSRFEFVGVALVESSYGVNQVLPIYRTFNKQGQYFDYAPIHWGTPIIMEGA